ncbi:hypothetical protein Q8A73_007354 [Channa argus]|nr:hypothetical protein Q8A73_007354 [Channa argus]
MWQQHVLPLSVTITGSLSASWDMVVSPEVTVSIGEDIVLSCAFTHPRQQDYSGIINVKWFPRNSNAEPLFSCSVTNDSMNGPNHCLSPPLRFSLHGDPRRGELSLLIRTVQLTDDDAYICSVQLDSRWNSIQKSTELHVTAKPQILSLRVLETPSGSDRMLQCEVEGDPQPKIVWLSDSRRQLENQGWTFESGPYRQISSVPYLEEEVLTCRAESKLGEAERMFPADNSLVIALTVCGLILLLLLLLSAGVIVYCRTKRGAATEIELHYSTITRSTLAPSEPAAGSRKRHEDSDVCYTAVSVQ